MSGAIRPVAPVFGAGPFPRVGTVSTSGLGGVTRGRGRLVRPLRVPTAPVEPTLSTPTDGPAAPPFGPTVLSPPLP